MQKFSTAYVQGVTQGCWITFVKLKHAIYKYDYPKSRKREGKAFFFLVFVIFESHN